MLMQGLAAATLLSGSLHAQTLNILVEGGGEMQQQAIADAFTAETGVEVNFTVVPYAGVFERLSTEIASGRSNFDLATIDVVWNAYFAPYLDPIDDLFTDEVLADLPLALVEDARVDGRYIGMPAWANAEILFYRTDLFEDPAEQAAFRDEYGYDLAPPTNWDEFRDVAVFFTRDTTGDGRTDLYGTDVKGAFSEEWMAHVLQAGSPGVILDDDNNVIIDNDEHVAALEFYVGLHCEYQVSPGGVLETGWAEAQNLFNQGNTAMMRFWGHAYKQIPEDAVVAGNVGAAPMIAGEAGIAAIPGPWYNVIPSTSAQKELAREFIAFAIANNHLGIDSPLGLAATNSAYERYATEPGNEHYFPLMETLGANATRGRPLHEDFQEIVDEAVLPALQEALECRRAPADILSDARRWVEDIL
ncbi:sugar ABC transporter substrate-binding protein [Natronospirillum operosum]|uniref:Sugar ABC transporter substrate-binding protein n=2 Tax=Natronospirillum operosum TaxID=2759953 RepID=A0A4Z0WET8_9GAMM|nr:sugar ABC transporter substrate-binding protein [Natronospirillum operosum]